MSIPESVKKQIISNDPRYTCCNINSSGISDADIQELTNLLSQNQLITELSLYHNNITNKGAKQLARSLPHTIQILNLGANQLDDRCLPALLGIKTLRLLDLSSNHITNKGAEVILDTPTKLVVQLYHTSIDPLYLEKIAQRLNPINEHSSNIRPYNASGIHEALLAASLNQASPKHFEFPEINTASYSSIIPTKDTSGQHPSDHTTTPNHLTLLNFSH